MTAGVTRQHEAALDAGLRTRFVELIRERFGLNLAGQQLAALDRAVEEVAVGSRCETPAALYRASTSGQPDLLLALATRLTVGETHFYRIGPQIDALRQTVLPELVATRAASRQLRLWVAGCSTGEEAYTLAILLREQPSTQQGWDIRLLATDINKAALETARRGSYSEWSFRDTPKEVRERYFVPEGKRWRLIEPVRRMVEFAQGNLADNPLRALDLGDGELDLILCRNVTIYFSPDAAQTLYNHFAAALAPNGWLILGPSDPPPLPHSVLQPVYLPGAILRRKTVTPAGAGHIKRPTPTNAYSGSMRSNPRVSTQPTKPRVERVRLSRLDRMAGRETDRAEQIGHLRALIRSDEQMALEHLERLTRAGTLDAESYLLLGMLYLDRGALQSALESLRRATFLDTDNALAHFSLAHAYRHLGHVDRARAAFIHARRLLSLLPGKDAVPDSDGLTVDDLRHAIDTQLSNLGNRHEI